MKLATQVGLDPSHIALDGNPAPLLQKGGTLPISANVYFGQMAGWIKMPLCMEVDLYPGHIVLDGDSAPPPQNGAHPVSPPSNFRPMSIVDKRSPISATAEHL